MIRLKIECQRTKRLIDEKLFNPIKDGKGKPKDQRLKKSPLS